MVPKVRQEEGEEEEEADFLKIRINHLQLVR